MSAGGNDKETKPVDDVEDCVICFQALTNSGRTLVTLQCRHQFHLDCIGSAFNKKNKMECPLCRRTEKGQWLYANPVDPSIPPVGNSNWNSANHPVIYLNWDYIEDEVGVDNQSLQEMQPIEQSESELPPGFEVFDLDMSPMERRLSSQNPEPLGTSNSGEIGRESNVEGDGGERSLGEESG